MNVSINKVVSGRATGNKYIAIDGIGYIQALYLDFGHGTNLCYAVRRNSDFSHMLALTFYDACQFLGVDCDELIDDVSKIHKGGIFNI